MAPFSFSPPLSLSLWFLLAAQVLLALRVVALGVSSLLPVETWQWLPILVDTPAKPSLSALGWTALFLFVEALIVTVWDVEASGVEDVCDLQSFEDTLHLSKTGTLNTHIL